MFVQIARTVRFCVDPSRPSHFDTPRSNTFAGWPSMDGIGAYYELDVVCQGRADPTTGYLISISKLDKLAREHSVPAMAAAMRDRPSEHPGSVIARVLDALHGELGQMLVGVRWRLTPYYCVQMQSGARHQVLMSQQFEFSAAHRLHCDSLDEQTNRQLFGKCNNANGHGHNYRIEVAVTLPLPHDGGDGMMRLGELERIVDQTVIQRFDHKHLNLDTTDFAGLNPSVEHIAMVCHDLLQGPIKTAGAQMHHVTVWETAKTSCTYPAPPGA